jgi:hypothetical protein
MRDVAPFHQQAEDVGKFLAEDRARDGERSRPDGRPSLPSENAD